MDTDYLDTNRAAWRTEPIADLVAWTHELTTQWNDISWTEYMLWLSDVTGVRKLRDAVANGANSAAVRNAADMALIIAEADVPLHLSHSRVRTALAPLIGTVFTSAETDALLDKGQQQVEHWMLMGGELEEQDSNRATMLEQARA